MRRSASWLGVAITANVLSLAMGMGICAAAPDNSERASSSVSGSSSRDPKLKGCVAGPGWECVQTSEISDATRQIIDLKEQVIKARGKRLGWTIGPSIGIDAIVTSDFDVKYVPAVGLHLTWGWRSK